MAPWLRLIEAWMVQQLLRTPAFHRAVEKIARSVHRIRYGLPPDSPGGTQIDDPDKSGLLRHFADEVKTQLGQSRNRDAASGTSSAGHDRVSTRAENGSAEAAWEDVTKTRASPPFGATAPDVKEEGADEAWENTRRVPSQAPKRGLLGEYVGALREQLGRKHGGIKTPRLLVGPSILTHMLVTATALCRMNDESGRAISFRDRLPLRIFTNELRLQDMQLVKQCGCELDTEVFEQSEHGDVRLAVDHLTSQLNQEHSRLKLATGHFLDSVLSWGHSVVTSVS